MKKVVLHVMMSLVLASGALYAEKITVFAAADLRFALDEVKALYEKKYPSKEDSIETIYGSSGKGMHQIENGAPYHLYFSANEAFVEKLYQEGHVIEVPKRYALGRIVLWSKDKAFEPKKGLDNFNAPWVKKIAIANPKHAPYGEKAKQALEAKGLYASLESKLVLGENISHTAQFIETGGADIGIIALSLALAPSIAKSEHAQYYLIDLQLHEPLIQSYSITKYAKESVLARNFYAFIQTDEAKAILKQYGFEVPEALKK